ncbi:MAG: RNA polymerase sigma factor [Hyphomicrobiaceae bacterium]
MIGLEAQSTYCGLVDAPSTGTRAPARSAEALRCALQRAAAGDRDALEEIYAASAAKLYSAILSVLKRRDLADDVLQECFLRAWQRASSFNPSLGSPMTWLLTIARNCAMDELRRKVAVSIDDCPEVDSLCSTDDAVAGLEVSEARARLARSLRQLDDEKRSIVLMIFVAGMTHQAVGQRLGKPTSAISRTLRQSLAQLRTALDA